MIVLFVLFVVFAVGIPVVLEERHHRGDNVLKRLGIEIVHSPLARRLGLGMSETKQVVSAVVAAFFVLVIGVLGLIGLINMLLRALF